MQATEGSILALKPKADITISPKQGAPLIEMLSPDF